MCMFSGRVEHVSNTQIFGRLGTDGYQYLAYQMQLKAEDEVAMVLPLPVANGLLEFIDLSVCKQFFIHLAYLFPPVMSSFGSRSATPVHDPAQTLEVLDVGSFEASFVPTRADFSRLSPIFRLPDTVLRQLPNYHDFSFAVFKLKSGRQELHPMAFRFKTRSWGYVFYPTVHVHDGTVPQTEEFDHRLYLQCLPEQIPPDWEPSMRPLASLSQLHRTAGLITDKVGGARLILRGRRPNADVMVPVGTGLPWVDPDQATRDDLLRRGLKRKPL